MATTPTQNAVPSESPRDLKFNAGKFDEVITSMAKTYVDRLGYAHYTIEGLKGLIVNAIVNLGLNPVGTFQAGATLTAANDIIQDSSSGLWYRWDNVSTLPKNVPTGSTPESTGGAGPGAWLVVDVTDILRRELAEIGGAAQVGAEFTDGTATTVQGFLDANDSASYRDRNITRLAQLDYVIHSRGSFKVLFQGDSMTAGYDVTSTDSVPAENGDWARHATTTYPERFISYINEQAGVTASAVIRAISGYTARQAYQNPEWQTNPGCDIAVLMYGINDADGVEGATHEVYMQYMELLIRRYIDWGMAVVVMSCANGSYGAADKVAQSYARQIKNLSTVYGCAYFNANEVQYRRIFASTQSDGGHFNSNGYAKLGESLASMFMSGGLMPHYKGVSSEITVWPGIQSDQVAYIDARNNVSLGRGDAAYTLQKITGAIVAGNVSIMSFSFYLDAEAADIEVIGSWTESSKLNFVIQQETKSQEGVTVPYYYPENHFSDNSKQGAEFKTGAALVNEQNNSGAPKYLGQVIGRGWRTITIYSALDGSSTDNAYIQGITINPVSSYLSSRQSAGSLRRGVKEVLMLSYPYRDFHPLSGIPESLPLESLVMPLPHDLYPLSWSNGSNYFDCGFAKIVISGLMDAVGPVYFEAIIAKGGAGSNLFVTPIAQSPAAGTWGTVTATVGIKPKKTVVAAGSVATNMPLENITGIGDDNSFTATTTPNEFGLFIKLSFAWPAATPKGYWNVSLESFARGSGGSPMIATLNS